MRTFPRLISIACLLAVTGSAPAQENPHEMTLPDGSTDASKCSYCHNDDLSLSRTQTETCTFCHSETVHSGALEHARASAAAVARHTKEGKQPALPLTSDGRIYCGTCHLFHDPVVMGEDLLDSARQERASPLNGNVRTAVQARDRKAADGFEAKTSFQTDGTRYLRLPNADGTLCQSCHGGY